MSRFSARYLHLQQFRKLKYSKLISAQVSVQYRERSFFRKYDVNCLNYTQKFVNAVKDISNVCKESRTFARNFVVLMYRVMLLILFALRF